MIRNNLRFCSKDIFTESLSLYRNDSYVVSFSGHPVNKFAT